MRPRVLFDLMGTNEITLLCECPKDYGATVLSFEAYLRLKAHRTEEEIRMIANMACPVCREGVK